MRSARPASSRAHDALPVAVIVHASDGRTRLRFHAHRGAGDALGALANGLGKLGSVQAVEVRAMTGSLLVLHEGDFADIAQRAAAEGLFAVATAPAVESAPLALRRPLPALAALAFAGLGVRQLFGRHVLPPALTLFWYAASLVRELGGSEAQGDDE